jgi:cysteinyl-tRNA synthetase
MALQLFNTLTRRVEEFTPVRPGRVSMYTCGPTVWNYAHIGNFRTFLFEDLLRRWLEASRYQVLHIMNLTDVDDRIIKEAGARGVSIGQFTEPFAQAFHEDRRWLRIRDATVYPKATEYVKPMIGLVEGLLAKGIAYKGEDGSVYFAIARFPAYGQLSQLDRRELKTGAGAAARVATDEYAKEDARDFALWKAARPEDEAVGAAWDAPFGRGRPGWHLECSAMALDLLKREWNEEVLDIHAGGVDLIFPHHEDEIAQSCAFTGQDRFARYWLHGEFLNVRGTKMSKRFGNITTPRDLREDGVDPGAIRLLMFGTHYRQKMDLTDESLVAAREGSRRLGEFGNRLEKAGSSQADEPEAFVRAGRDFIARFTSAMDNDMNSAEAMGAVFDLVRDGNRLLDSGIQPGPTFREAWRLQDGVLNVLPAVTGSGGITIHAEITGSGTVKMGEHPPADPTQAESWATYWASERRNARSARNFAEADRIRDLLKRHGWEVRDNKDGSVGVVRAG